jgi:hypothetical protein
MTIDNYRTGRRELPPAGFHLERGIALFIVYLVYAVVFAIPGGIIQGSAVGHDSARLQALGDLVGFVFSVLLAFLSPAILLYTYRAGFKGGFDLSGIWQMSTANVANTIIAGLVIWVASFIGWIGFLACCVGILFTFPYAASITGGVVTWYEQVTSGPAPVPS